MFAIAAYPILRLVEWIVLPAVLPSAPNAPMGLALISTPSPGFGLGLTGDAAASLSHKLSFWLMMAGLFALLPLLAPRVLLLELPWFLFSMQSPQLVWTTIGFQYTAIAVMPLAIASIYGYARIRDSFLPWLSARGERRAPNRTDLVSAGVRSPDPSRGHRRSSAILCLVVTVLIVGTNVQVGPLNPMNQRPNGALPGFNVEYIPPPGFSNVVILVGMIPASAYVLASSDLFPLVANDLNAYALLWTPQPPGQLPFGPGHLAVYLLLSTDQGYAAPNWLINAIVHHSYGLRASVPELPGRERLSLAVGVHPVPPR